MNVSRRTFLKLATVTGASGLVGRPKKSRAAISLRAPDESLAMLFDATLCVGCRACEAACSEANRLSEPVMPGEESVFDKRRPTDPRTYTVVNRYLNAEKDGGAPTFVKSQCMHCVEPACASACPVRALEKTEEGPIIYHKDRCIGCRYCIVACPFGIPKFEYEKAIPYVQKCTFCADRRKQGKLPACSEVCPTGALRFGKRKDLLEMAKIRIYRNPDQYVHHIYGENEVGGTGMLYISNVPFEKLGFQTNLGTRPYAELTRGSLSTVPFVLVLGPPLLMALYTLTKKREETAQAVSEKKES
jgi:formate dehydrogenase beta subunit